MPVGRPARIEAGYGDVSARLRDVGLCGASLEVAAFWPLPSRRPLGLQADLAPGASLEMTVMLAHRQGDRAGVRCLSMSDGSLRLLTAMLELRYGDRQRVAAEVDRLQRQLGQTQFI